MKFVDLTDLLKGYNSQRKFFQKLSRDSNNLKIVKKYLKKLTSGGEKNRDLTTIEIFTLIIFLIDADQDPKLETNMLIIGLKNNFASLFEMSKILNRVGILDQENFAIILHAQDRHEVTEALIFLYKARIFTPSNRELLVSKSSYSKAIITLYKERLLDQENLDACISSPYPELMAQAFTRLRSAKIFNTENKGAVLISHPLGMANALIELNNASLLTAENREVLCSFSLKNDLEEYTKCFAVFNEFNQLSQDNFEILMQIEVKNVENFGWALLALEKEYIATKENRELLLSTKKPKLMADALILLKRCHIVSLKNLSLLQNRDETCYKIACILRILKIAQLLTVTHREIIRNAWHFPNQMVEFLQETNLLSQENFRVVMRYAAVFDHINYTPLKCFMLTRTVFSHIIGLCEKSGNNLKQAILDIDTYIEKLTNLQQLVSSALAANQLT